MEIIYDPAKNARNIATRGLSFERVVDMDWGAALVACDERRDYPEQRFIALGTLDGRLHVACFTPIDSGIRVISFRRANAREVARYAKATSR